MSIHRTSASYSVDSPLKELLREGSEKVYLLFNLLLLTCPQTSGPHSFKFLFTVSQVFKALKQTFLCHLVERALLQKGKIAQSIQVK